MKESRLLRITANTDHLAAAGAAVAVLGEDGLFQIDAGDVGDGRQPREHVGKLGGEFYTPRSVVKLMVDMLEPFNGRVYDPACGSAGMFVQADRFVKAHDGVRDDISVFGQEQNPTTWRLATGSF